MTTVRILCLCVALFTFVTIANSAPQGNEKQEKPMPYDYTYEVKDQEKNLFFGANELGDESGKVTGGYKVLLPDGRLMTVEYSVEGDSGFVPKISFQPNYNPF